MRNCKRCGEPKTANDFYESRPRVCKECVKTAARKNYAENRERYHAYEKERWQRVDRRKDVARNQRRRRRRHPERDRARRMVAYHRRSGNLVPEACQDCGSVNRPTEAHHEDYSKPLDVIWLCFQCHRARHGQVATSRARRRRANHS